MESAIDAITKLDRMIDRDLSFFQDRQLNLKRGSIEPVIRAAIESIRPLSLANGVEIVQKLLSAGPDLPAIAIDEDQMQLVFINLIRNACQAMPTGGIITISVFIEAYHTNRPLVQSFTQADVDRLVISIKDTGIGIPSAEQSQIFDAFYTTKSKGLGLGLLNVKNVIESHGGQIVVDSQIGRGTEFTIRIPLAQPL
jgi:signal transduction histidine kinase